MNSEAPFHPSVGVGSGVHSSRPRPSSLSFGVGGQGTTGSHYVAHAGLKPDFLLLPQAPECWEDPSALDSRLEPGFRSHRRLCPSSGWVYGIHRDFWA